MIHDVPEDLVLSYAPPAPLPGGGRERRGRRALWGIAPIAADPSVWKEGPGRRRLVRAATVTGVMSLAWASTTTLGDAPRPIGPGEGPAAAAVAADHAAPLEFDFVRYVRGDDSDQASGTPVATPVAARPPDPGAWRGTVMASFEDVDLMLPSPHVDMVGFHEAASATAHELELGARPDVDLGVQEVSFEDVDDDLETMVLPARGRATGSATAVDVAMPAGREVVSPISGTVESVEPYLLYGRHPDTRIVITPDGRPDLKLVVLHVTGHEVAVGDRVTAGKTVLAASATPFPFESQIDRFVEDNIGRATPHVHLEVSPS